MAHPATQYKKSADGKGLEAVATVIHKNGIDIMIGGADEEKLKEALLTIYPNFNSSLFHRITIMRREGQKRTLRTQLTNHGNKI